MTLSLLKGYDMDNRLPSFLNNFKPVYDTALLAEEESIDLTFLDHKSLNSSALHKIQKIKEFFTRFDDRLN